ncbi:acetate--CoA ligase family protein [Caldivirga sp. UBA161]|uniref:acetate--CoA ligase family protein n=1 Tax=Caldivirga sp. UBA161 TaxID=1915569 RepID=UPI0025BC44FB|nr:CoA-binding protein [Caldivirga sp. UBA161]
MAIEQTSEAISVGGRGIEVLFYPSSVAVIGATPKPGHVGYVIMSNLLSKFKGKVILVNPRYDSINGVKCYKSITEVNDEVDLAVVAVPAPVVPQVTADAVKKGVKALIIISGGFSEVGDEGRRLEDEVREIVKNTQVRVLGPNCIGVYNADNGLDTFFLPEDRMGRPPKGPIALISQSGAVAAAILDWASRRRLGIGLAVNYGNKLDVNESELLEYLANNSNVKVITIYMEGLKYPGEGLRFLETAKKVTQMKPVIVYKAGRTKASAGAVASHTAALAGDYEIYRGAFRQAGLIEANSVREMFDLAKALATQPLPRGRRVLVLTDSGGMGIQAVDTLSTLGLEVPELPETIQSMLRKFLPPLAIVRNPVDVTGSATDEYYKIVLDSILPTSYVDMAIIIALMQIPGLTPNLVNYIIDAKRYGKPMVVVSFGGSTMMEKFNESLEDSGIPVYATPDRGARALWALVQYSMIKKMLREGVE